MSDAVSALQGASFDGYCKVEEAGLVVNTLKDLGPVRYEEPEARIVGRVYLGRSDEQPVSHDGEAVAFDRIRLADMSDWVGNHQVCEDSLRLVLPLLRQEFV